jgi:hypothetical protein
MLFQLRQIAAITLCPASIPATSDRQTSANLLAAPSKATPDLLTAVAVTANFPAEIKISGTPDARG